MNQSNTISKFQYVKEIFWFLALFSYFFQFPFTLMAKLITPCLFIFLLMELPNIKIPKNKWYVFSLFAYVAFILINGIFSLFNGTEFSRVARFLMILLAIPYCVLIRDKDFDRYKKILTNLALAKSIMIILLAVIILIFGDQFIRAWIWEHDYGDIYLLSRLVPKVQVKGNALLVVVFFLSFFENERYGKPKTAYCSTLILLGGVIFAGNFAYVLGLLLFVFYYAMKYIIKFLKAGKIKIRHLVVLAIAAMVVLTPYVYKKIVEKSEHSNKVRFEQIEVLMDTNYLYGNGLGHEIIAKTSEREYNGDLYFELQTLYIFNQIGIVGLALFYVVTIFPFYKRSKELTILYLIYLCYTFWNPYCFDSVQMFAILSIMNLLPRGEQDEESDYYSLLSYQG